MLTAEAVEEIMRNNIFISDPTGWPKLAGIREAAAEIVALNQAGAPSGTGVITPDTLVSIKSLEEDLYQIEKFGEARRLRAIIEDIIQTPVPLASTEGGQS